MIDVISVIIITSRITLTLTTHDVLMILTPHCHAAVDPSRDREVLNGDSVQELFGTSSGNPATFCWFNWFNNSVHKS